MKIFEKTKTVSGDRVIKRYKFLGLSLFKKDFTSAQHKYKLLGIPVYKKKVANTVDLEKRRQQHRAIEIQHRNIIYNSDYFDSDWYRHYYYWVEQRRNDLALDCLRNGRFGARNPGPEFYANEYLIINPDVKEAGMHPVLHYERFGWKENRRVSFAAIKKYVFPEKTIELEQEFFSRQSYQNKIVSVFASFSGDGKIENYVVYLLEGLKKVSDYIIFIGDNPIFEEELEKIKSLCNACIFKRHEEYDFGSYKYGFRYLQTNNILEKDDHLIFLNDSNYGPVFPFSEVISKYRTTNVDFYGLTLGKFPRRYLQSFFYLFSPNVYNSSVFIEYFNSVKKELSQGHVIYKYEFTLTDVLSKAGYTYDSFIPEDTFALQPNNHAIIPTKYTHTLLEKHRFPLVKIKVMLGSTAEPLEEIESYIQNEHSDFYKMISSHLQKRRASILRKKTQKLSKYNLYKQYDCTKERIKAKLNSGGKIKCVFLVNMISMFAAENLMIEMLKDTELYDVELYAIPEIRFGNEELINELDKTYNSLKEKYPFAKKAVDVKDGEIVQYNDVILDADIVCYPSPYDVSYSLYNPYYAAKNGILSIHINYGFFRSKYDRILYRMDNYNNFWRVFLETEFNMEEYKNFGQCNAENAVLIGYAKMDRLFSLMNSKKASGRKKIVIAPHHSIDGGVNPTLALSNFERYSDLFLKLPSMYPDIDFVFRPHPALFTNLSMGRKWDEEKMESYINELKSFDNLIYSDSGDYMQVFAESDAIIQDSGSFLVEYFYTGKPCCYLLKDENDIESKFVDLGKKCLEHCYLSYNEEEIISFIEDVVINGYDHKKEEREKFANEAIMLNYPSASKKISDYIKTEFL